MSAPEATSPQEWSADSWALPVADLRSALLDRLDAPAGRRWEALRSRVLADPSSLPVEFPGTGRAVGRAHLFGSPTRVSWEASTTWPAPCCWSTSPGPVRLPRTRTGPARPT